MDATRLAPARIVEVLVGPDAPSALATVIAELKDGDPFAPVTVVAPSFLASLVLRRAVARRSGAAEGNRGIANVRFAASVGSLAESLAFADLAASGLRPASPTLVAAAVRACLAADPGPFGNAAPHRSTEASVLRSLEHLWGVVPEARRSARDSDDLHRYLIRILSLVDDRLHVAGCYTRADLFARATEIATGPTEDDRHSPPIGPVVAYLPAELTGVETLLLRALAERPLEVPAVTAILPVPDTAPGPDRALPGARVRVLPPDVASISAPDPDEEVRAVLRSIAARAASGVPLYRIAILYTASQPYRLILHDQLAGAGIPYFGPIGATLSTAVPGRCITGLLDLALLRSARRAAIAASSGTRDGVADRDLFRWLSSAPVAVPGIDIGAPLRCAPVAAWEALASPFNRGAHTSPEFAALARFRRQLDDDLNHLASASTWNERAAATIDLLERYLHVDGGTDAVDADEPVDEITERVCSTIRSLAELDAVDPHPDLTTFRYRLATELSSSRSHAGTAGVGIMVAPLSAARGLTFDLLHVVGLNEGLLPRRRAVDPMLGDDVRHRSGIPMLSDDHIRQWDDLTSCIASSGSAVLSYARRAAGAYSAQFPSPWMAEILATAHSVSVNEAERCTPGSAAWARVIGSFGTDPVPDLQPASLQELDIVELALWRELRGEPRTHLESHDLCRIDPRLARSFAASRQRDWAAPLNPYSGRVGRGAGFPQPLSATVLDKAVACPFSYFLASVLRVSERRHDEAEWDIPADIRGRMYHAVLEELYRPLASADHITPSGAGGERPWDPDGERAELLDRLGDVVRSVVARYGATTSAIPPVLFDHAISTMQSDIARYIEEDFSARTGDGARVVAVEQRFGTPRASSGDVTGASGSAWPAPEIVAEDGSVVAFTGIIDRVDYAPGVGDGEGSAGIGHFAVIDYKTSRLPSSSGDKEKAIESLQLPVYAAALRAAAACADSGLPPVPEGTTTECALHFPRGIKQRFSAPSGVEQGQTRLTDTVSTMSELFSAGLFPARPGAHEYARESSSPPTRHFANCLYCDFEPICPQWKDRTWEARSTLPELQPYVALVDASPEDEVPGEPVDHGK